jgi:hypothetical protein
VNFGESAELVLHTLIVYLTASPTLDSSSPVFVTVSDGWKQVGGVTRAVGDLVTEEVALRL